MCRKLALAATAITLIAVPAMAQARDKAPAKPASAQAQKAQQAQAAQAAPPRANAEQRAQAERADPLARAAFWNSQVAADAQDTEAGVKLAAALRALGRSEEASRAAQAVIIVDPRHVEAHLEIGRARIAEGKAFYGIESLRMAQSLSPRDWRPVSLLGVAYEQVGRDQDALVTYDQALALSPENPSVLSNIAMFHATRGDPAKAEAYLRRAIARPGATVQMRQNLAFVLGVQGKIADAERLLREDLPPEVANNNLAYLRAMSAAPQPVERSTRTWESLRNGGS